MTDVMPRHWYDSYACGRPAYPSQVLDLPDLRGSATVLELAAGTGKFTLQLTDKFPHVIAVEPDSGMRRLLVDACRDAEIRGVLRLDGMGSDPAGRATTAAP